jgi:hypothetical protein
LSKLSRYEARLSYRYFKALEHLQKIQGTRQQATNPKQRPPATPSPNEANAKGPAGNEIPKNEIDANKPAASKPAENSTGTTRTAATAQPRTGPWQMGKAPRQSQNGEAAPIAPNEPNCHPERQPSNAVSAWPSPAQVIQPHS